jgi:hypothetical protein
MGHYPSEIVLERIKKFDIFEEDIEKLIELIENEWEFADCGYFTYKGKYRNHRLLKLSTGGWSGNEEIIDALKSNFAFWSAYWWKEERGGHYWFKIKSLRGFEK